MGDDAQQIDWISLSDKRAALNRELRASVERIGLSEVAHQLDEDPSTISNQIARTSNRRPSGDLFALCLLIDPIFRARCVGQCGEELVRRTDDLSPREALRLIVARAAAEWDRRALREVHEIVGRVGKEDK